MPQRLRRFIQARARPAPNDEPVLKAAVDGGATALLRKVAAVEPTAAFFRHRIGEKRAEDMRAILAMAPDVPPTPGDERPP